MHKFIVNNLQDGNLTTNLVDNILWKGNEKIYTKKDDDQEFDSFLGSFKKWYLDNNHYSRIEDPTFLSFRLIIDWNSPLFMERDKRVDTREQKIIGSGESLSFYLSSINQDWRRDKILSFKRKFKELIDHRFHYLKSMEGLGNHWKFSPKSSFNEQDITIHTIESMDMFISSMADDYLQATYDIQQMKNVAPINLRYFDLIVVVHEIRNIKSLIKNFDGLSTGNRKMMEEHGGDSDRSIVDRDDMVFLNPYIGTHAYRFQDCTFDFSETMSYLSNISNEGSKEVSTKFKIKLGRIDFRYHDLDIFSTSHRKQRFLTEIEPFVYTSSSVQSQKNRDMKRFKKDDDTPKTKWENFRDKVTKLAVDEAKKTTHAVTRAIDKTLQKTTQEVTRSIKSKLDKLETETRPSNFIGRHANRLSNKFSRNISRNIDRADGKLDDIVSSFLHSTHGIDADPDEEQGKSIIKNHNDGFLKEDDTQHQSLRSVNGFDFPEQEDTTLEQLREIITENRTMFEHYKSIFEESMSQNSRR